MRELRGLLITGPLSLALEAVKGNLHALTVFERRIE